MHQTRSILQATPFAWIIMNKRTVKAYKAVIEKLKELLPNFSPKVCISDYEKGLRRALRECFPRCKVLGCHFHYSQVSFAHFTDNIASNISYL